MTNLEKIKDEIIALINDTNIHNEDWCCKPDCKNFYYLDCEHCIREWLDMEADD